MFVKNLPFVSRGCALGALVLALVILSAPMSQAAFITPSQVVVPPPSGEVGVPMVSGVNPGTLLASNAAPFTFNTTGGITTGTLLSAVFLNPTGTLDFYYQVTNNVGSASSLRAESNVAFGGFLAAVAFRADCNTGAVVCAGGFVAGNLAEAPQTADRNADPTGNTIGFNFTPAPPGQKIEPGTTSPVLIISTNATNWKAGNAEVLDGGSATVAAFQPAAAVVTGVPEPASLALIGFGLVALAGVRRFSARVK
jgi:hypothetical protein